MMPPPGYPERQLGNSADHAKQVLGGPGRCPEHRLGNPVDHAEQALGGPSGGPEHRLGNSADHAEQVLGGPGVVGAHRGWYSRGFLPHADFPAVLQFITYRLADSLPAGVVARLREEIDELPADMQDAEQRRRIEALMDAGHGCCALRDARIASMVQENWQNFCPERYDLIAWVIMPNHVHLLIRARESWPLGRIVQSWKSFTGRRIRAAYGTGWMREYWDRFIRDERHFAATINYIHQNPVRAGLVSRAEEWPWSSYSEVAEQVAGIPGCPERQLGNSADDAEQALGGPSG